MHFLGHGPNKEAYDHEVARTNVAENAIERSRGELQGYTVENVALTRATARSDAEYARHLTRYNTRADEVRRMAHAARAAEIKRGESRGDGNGFYVPKRYAIKEQGISYHFWGEESLLWLSRGKTTLAYAALAWRMFSSLRRKQSGRRRRLGG